MEYYTLEEIERQDIDDFLYKIEKSFNIKFEERELLHVVNFGEFCDHVLEKMNLENSTDCTTQQAFNKLSNAISSALNMERNHLTPDTLLETIFVFGHRRSRMKRVEKQLGFHLNLFSPHPWLSKSINALFLLAIILFFFNVKNGFLTLCLGTIFYCISKLTASFMDCKTLGELANKMKREQYVLSRSNPKTMNKKEIEGVIIDLFCLEFELDKNQLNRESKFEEVSFHSFNP